MATDSISILEIVGGPWGSPGGRWRNQIHAVKRSFSCSGGSGGQGVPAGKETVEAVQVKGDRQDQEAVKGTEEEPAGRGDGWICGRGDESRTTSWFLESVVSGAKLKFGHPGVPLRIRSASWLSARLSSKPAFTVLPKRQTLQSPFAPAVSPVGAGPLENILRDI